MNMDAHAALPGNPQAAHQAREIVRDVLGEHHPAADDASVVTSELVTNAVIHTGAGEPGGSLLMSVAMSRQEPRNVYISVRDGGAADRPAAAHADRDSEHGRGLAIVAALAAEWGTEPRGQGRVTWCRLTHEPSEPRVADACRRNLWPELNERRMPEVELEAEP